MRVAVLMLIVCTLACNETPARPASVAPAAEWAGGADGGSWILCEQMVKEPYAGFRCTMWSDGGAVSARGNYVHTSFAGGKWVPDPSPWLHLDYSAYDGVVVHLMDHSALVPDGEIDHPFEPGHGKRTTYDMGVEVREESY